jgi:hypothetical protein
VSRNRANSIPGQFAGRLIEMLEAPAYRVLSLSAHRVLSRIEIELGHHGGKDNGRLPVTYENFENYGIDRGSRLPRLSEKPWPWVSWRSPNRAGQAMLNTESLIFSA